MRVAAMQAICTDISSKQNSCHCFHIKEKKNQNLDETGPANLKKRNTDGQIICIYKYMSLLHYMLQFFS